MKKTLLYVATGLTLLTSQACKKTTTVTPESSETVSASLNSNESYRYALAANGNADDYSIATGSSNGATVSIESDSSGTAFVYTPAGNFVGSDEIIITREKGSGNGMHDGKHKRHGKPAGGLLRAKKKAGCNKEGGEARHRITFNITVQGVQD